MIDWVHAGPSVLAAFLASLVEFVEALTIVMAVGTVRGWRPAMIGTVAGAVLLAVLVLLFGPALQRIPIHVLQMVVGALLLLFGMRWLRKAVLRSAGVIKLHDEEKIYARETEELRANAEAQPERIDGIAVATTFKAVMLEGLEVVFIVIATGAIRRAGQPSMLIPASLGAAAAGVLVILLGFALRAPLSRVPENTLKYAVGLLLSAFGAFWLGEGLNFGWPGDDLAIPVLALVFLAVSWIGVLLARRARTQKQQALNLHTKSEASS